MSRCESLWVKSDWQNGKEERVERGCRFVSLFVLHLYYFEAKLLNYCAILIKRALSLLQPWGGMFFTFESKMVYSERIVLHRVFSGQKHGFQSKRAFLALSEYLGTIFTKGAQDFNRYGDCFIYQLKRTSKRCSSCKFPSKGSKRSSFSVKGLVGTVSLLLSQRHEKKLFC